MILDEAVLVRWWRSQDHGAQLAHSGAVERENVELRLLPATPFWLEPGIT